MKKGILITIIVVVLILVVLALGVGYIYIQFNKEPYIPEHSFLQIDFNGPIVEVNPSVFSNDLSIKDLWFHIKRAKIDPRIEGIILKISYIKSGMATMADIGKLVKDFKRSGKKVVAYLESGGIKEYYLATFADKVYVFKGGFLFLKGLAAEAMFLKNTLSKLGIQAQIFHIGDYKTASNMFTEDRMTPAHRESLEKLLDDMYYSTLSGIAENRNLSVETVEKIFEKSPIDHQSYLDAKLIDAVVYEDEVIDKTTGGFPPVPFEIYKETTSPRPYKGMNKIAVIFANGEIHSGESGKKSLFGDEVLGSETLVEYLKEVRKNRFVKAVVLRVNSPGGSALASEAIRREAQLLSREKPLVISMADMAASGGYWLSMSSSHLMALPQTITGSIGVITGKFILKNLYNKIGVNKEMVKTTENADIYWDYRQFTPEEEAKLMNMMGYMYQEFLKIVSKNRGMKIEEVDEIGQGRVWAGISALNLKLIDKMGGLDDAIKEAEKLAQIPDQQTFGIKIYPRKKSFLETIFQLVESKGNVKASAIRIETDPLQSLEKKLCMYKKFFPAVIIPYKIDLQ